MEQPEKKDRSAIEGGKQEALPLSSVFTDLADHPFRIWSVAVNGLFLLAMMYTVYLAREVLLPIVIALLFAFLFRPVLRTLKNVGIPPGLGAAVILLVLFIFAVAILAGLVVPAAEWMKTIQKDLPKIETKIYRMVSPLEKVKNAFERAEEIVSPAEQTGQPQVQIKPPSLIDTLLSHSGSVVGGIAVTFILFYFFLAYGDLILANLIRVLPRFKDKRRVLEISMDIERQISTYLSTVTLANACLGLAVGIAQYVIGLPNPVLWGSMAAMLEFIPYLGPLTGIVMTAVVSLLTFDHIGYAMLAPFIYLVLTSLFGGFFINMLFGRRFALNPVVVVVWLIFWGWLWGIPGALLAVPMLATFKIFCDHVTPLTKVGQFIGYQT